MEFAHPFEHPGAPLTGGIVVEGQVAPGWEPVADEFERNFADNLELGAALAVYRDGATVVDLWAGCADSTTGRPWRRPTVACVFSATKGIAAICAHLLIQRGLLDLDAPVATYWPEFAGGGKQRLKVRWLLTHQAGLPSLDPDFSLDDLRASDPVLRAIECQQPLWEPGTQFTYHAITFGLLVGELIRRITGTTVGEMFAADLAEPLGLNAWLGLPRTAPVDLARLEVARPDTSLDAPITDIDPGFVKVITLGSALPFKLVTGGPGDFNDRRLLSIGLASSNLVSDARSLARLYAATVAQVDGVRLFTDETATACAPIHTAGTPIFGTPIELADAPHTQDFGLGFIAGKMLGPTSFGHFGASGAWGFADLDSRVGFGYVPNRMLPGKNVRAAALIDGVKKCL